MGARIPSSVQRAVHGLGRQDHQLPDRRELERHDQDRALAHVDFELYLPKRLDQSTRSAERRRRIPDEIEFRTKPGAGPGNDQAVQWPMSCLRAWCTGRLGIRRLVGVSRADSPAQSRLCRRHSRHDQGVARRWIRPSTWRGDQRQEARAANGAQASFVSVLWRDGTRGPLWSRFARLRVVVEHDDGWDPAKREDLWLLIEWPDNERDPIHYTLSSLPRGREHSSGWSASSRSATEPSAYISDLKRRARLRPLRRTALSRLAPPHLCRALLLRVHRR